MPLTEIRVGPPSLTIHQDVTVLVTDANGEIRPHEQFGLFALDTRFVSLYRFIINGESWLPVQALPLAYNHNCQLFTNPELHQFDDAPIPAHSLGFRVDRVVSEGMHEDLIVTNHSPRTVTPRFRIRIDGDFADLFDVHAHRYFSRGARDAFWDHARRELTIKYRRRDFERALIYRISNPDPQPHFSNGQLLFDLELASGASWRTCTLFSLVADGLRHDPVEDCHEAHAGSGKSDELHAAWCGQATALKTSSYEVRTIFSQAISDIGSLRMHEHDLSNEIWVPAAGVPWFMTLFGRDSLIVSFQNMMISPVFAVGALAKLAQFQAAADDPYRDAEPGKIMHEIRHGELAFFKMVPHTPYYGTADATILYIIVLSELFRWTGDRAYLERFRECALRCLSWIDRYGDRDGDGLQEYQTRSKDGYFNQGWKDAGDALLYPDGSVVKPPIATCELQGYVYDARLRMAEIMENLGDTVMPDRLRRQAEELRNRFEKRFWLQAEGFVALCLDGDKNPVPTIASNPGHCLWSGILEPDRAADVARRLFEPDLWSGWGLRTLSDKSAGYDPYEYQRGSVWPHDNGIIAAGLHRYGFRELGNRVAQGIFEAAAVFDHFRLPELFAGFSRSQLPYPVPYVRANVPQAWASGSVFHLLRGILGIHPDAAHSKLYVDPELPEWLPDLELERIRVGATELRIRFERAAGATNFEVVDSKGKVDVIREKPPWFKTRS